MKEAVIEQVGTTQAPAQATQVDLSQDILTKVAQVKAADPAPEVTTFKEFDDIKDPAAREIAITRDKQRQADYVRKTQELATQRRDLEQKLEQMKNWSPERIQNELLNNPQFLQAAQQIKTTQNPPNSGLTDEQYSVLTDNEKKELDSLKSEIHQLKESQSQAVIKADIQNKDAQLASRFADYNPVEINSAFEKLASMGVGDVREYIYKATQHDAHVKAAYELGRQEAKGLIQTKVNGFSIDGTTSVNNEGVPTKNKGETDHAFFVRLANHRLSEHRRK